MNEKNIANLLAWCILRRTFIIVIVVVLDIVGTLYTNHFNPKLERDGMFVN